MFDKHGIGIYRTARVRPIRSVTCVTTTHGSPTAENCLLVGTVRKLILLQCFDVYSPES